MILNNRCESMCLQAFQISTRGTQWLFSVKYLFGEANIS